MHVIKPLARDDISLSVIVPALNEERSIQGAVEGLIAALCKTVREWDIILIDDGSSDGTGAVAESLARKEPRIHVIHHDRPRGVGYSFLEGVKASSKRVVTWIPADGENDPDELLKYLPLIEHVDIVIPFVINTRVRPPLRRILSAVFLAIINATFRTHFNYTNGNNIYRKSVFDAVTPRSNGFLVHAECLVKAVRNGFAFAEVPVVLKKRCTGDSKALRLNSLFSICREYLALLWEMRAVRKTGGMADSRN